jgi:chromosome segregation ATPase
MLKYEKSKQLTEIKGKDSELQKEFERLTLEQETNEIKIMELNEQINSDHSEIKLLRLEKDGLVEELQAAKKKVGTISKDEATIVNAKVKELEQKCSQAEEKYKKLHEEWSALSKRND